MAPAPETATSVVRTPEQFSDAFFDALRAEEIPGSALPWERDEFGDFEPANDDGVCS